jgi:hypothetical protein
MNIIEELTCNYCKKIYEDPVILDCCQEDICRKDFEKIITNNETCPNVDCQSNPKTFMPNRKLKKLIETYELNKVTINSEHENVLREFREKIDKIEKINNDPENLIYEKFSVLKSKVDLDRENAKVYIDKLADDTLNCLNKYEKQFKQKCKSKIENCNDLIIGMRKEQHDYQNFISSLGNKNEDKDKRKEDIKAKIGKLDSEIQKYESELFENTTIEYMEMEKTSELKFKEIFGKLNVSRIISKIFFLL